MTFMEFGGSTFNAVLFLQFDRIRKQVELYGGIRMLAVWGKKIDKKKRRPPL